MQIKELKKRLTSQNIDEVNEALTVIKSMLDKDVEMKDRRNITRVLGSCKHDGAIEILLKFLDDESDKVRVEAASALYMAHSAQVVDALTHLLDDESRKVRNTARAALVYVKKAHLIEGMKSSFSHELFSSSIKHDDYDVRKIAATRLGELTDEGTTSLLIQMLNDPSVEIRQTVVNSLGQKGTVEALKALITAFDKNTFHVQVSILFAVPNIKHFKTVEFLTKKMLNKKLDDEMRVKAIGASTNMEDPKFMDVYYSLLGESSEKIRDFAMYALSRYRKYDPDIERMTAAHAVKLAQDVGMKAFKKYKR